MFSQPYKAAYNHIHELYTFHENIYILYRYWKQNVPVLAPVVNLKSQRVPGH